MEEKIKNMENSNINKSKINIPKINLNLCKNEDEKNNENRYDTLHKKLLDRINKKNGTYVPPQSFTDRYNSNYLNDIIHHHDTCHLILRPFQTYTTTSIYNTKFLY